MPPKQIMGWRKRERRWAKKFNGVFYYISPKQLGCEPTKEASQQAANKWWEKKQREIEDQLGKAKQHPAHVVVHYETAIRNHRLFAKWQRKYGNLQEAQRAETMAEWLQETLQSNDPPFPLSKTQEDPRYQIIQSLPFDEREAAEILWFDRLRQIQKEEAAEKSVPKENTIRCHIDDYLALRKTDARARNRLGSHDTFASRLNHFRSWVDPFAPIESIDEALWERFFVYLSQQVFQDKMSPASMAGVQGATRAFIRSRWERRFIELPRNLNSRNLAATVPLKEIEIFTTAEIKQLVGAASERRQLYLLLMLNAGMYPVDIAQMRQDEVDWKQGRIIRKRSKTRHRSENVPKVDYLLWRKTFKLLKKYRSEDPNLVLLNTNGTPLWVEGETDKGKFNRNNNIRTAYFQLQQKIKLTKEQRKPLKAIRKTAASKLEDHPEYGRYAEYFLGEAPSSIAARHYIRPSKEQFDAALKWLGEQFGIK